MVNIYYLAYKIKKNWILAIQCKITISIRLKYKEK